MTNSRYLLLVILLGYGNGYALTKPEAANSPGGTHQVCTVLPLKERFLMCITRSVDAPPPEDSYPWQYIHGFGRIFNGIEFVVRIFIIKDKWATINKGSYWWLTMTYNIFEVVDHLAVAGGIHLRVHIGNRLTVLSKSAEDIFLYSSSAVMSGYRYFAFGIDSFEVFLEYDKGIKHLAMIVSAWLASTYNVFVLHE